MEKTEIKILKGNKQADECAKYLMAKASPSSYLFLQNYLSLNVHLRRVQASILLEKFKTVDKEKTRDGKELSQQTKNQIKGAIGLEIITKACMAIDDLSIFANYITQIKGIEHLVSKHTSDGTIENFLQQFKNKKEADFFGLFSFPCIEQIACFDENEKAFVKECYDIHFKTTKSFIEKLNLYRERHKIAYLKNKHALPIVISPNLQPYKGENYLLVAILESKANKLKKHFILINDKLVENSFILICRITDFLSDLLLSKIHELECVGFRSLALHLYGLNQPQAKEFEKLSGKYNAYYKPYRLNILPQINFEISTQKMDEFVALYQRIFGS